MFGFAKRKIQYYNPATDVLIRDEGNGMLSYIPGKKKDPADLADLFTSALSAAFSDLVKSGISREDAGEAFWECCFLIARENGFGSPYEKENRDLKQTVESLLFMREELEQEKR